MLPQKHSRQRDAILAELCSRYDHPTAEALYFAVKPQLPALSLATVYRNLSQLCAEGHAPRIVSDGSVRFDGNAAPHCHVTCTECGAVADLAVSPDALIAEAQAAYEGEVFSGSVMFYGLCSAHIKNTIQ